MKLVRLAGIFLLMAAQAHAAIVIEGELARDYPVQPGQTIEGGIVVVNSGDNTAEVKVYQTDYLFNAEGQLFFEEPGSRGRSNAAWISFSAQHLAIPPKQRMNISYVIQVPAATTLKGSFWSVIMVEEVSPAAAPSDEIGVSSQVRYGIQLCTSIGNTGSTKVAFSAPKAKKDGKVTTFTVDIQNTGERFVRPSASLELYDTSGKMVAKVDIPPFRLYPEAAYRCRFALPPLPTGTYHALLVADCGESKRFGTSLSLNLAQ